MEYFTCLLEGARPASLPPQASEMAGERADGKLPAVPAAALRALRAALGRADDLRLSLYDQLPALLRARPANLKPEVDLGGLVRYRACRQAAPIAVLPAASTATGRPAVLTFVHLQEALYLCCLSSSLPCRHALLASLLTRCKKL